MYVQLPTEKAKELLHSRDKLDRKCERERIQTAHRERRLKFCQVMKGANVEDVASEGVRLAGASSSEDETDLVHGGTAAK